MGLKIAKPLCWIAVTFLSLPAWSGTSPVLSDFIGTQELQNDIAAFCLKRPVLNKPAESTILESTVRLSNGFRFESLRFETTKEALKVPDCTGVREMIIVSGPKTKKTKLFDSGFFPEAYCDDPFRYHQPPVVYELVQFDKTTIKRKLAVVEFESTVLNCPDIDDFKTRQYLIYDLDHANKLLLDIQADYVVPDNGFTSTLRLNFFHVTKVLKTAFKIPAGQLPYSIEVQDGKFSVYSSPMNETNPAPEMKSDKDRVKLDDMYSKDGKHVYIKTPDRSGVIEGADPKTFVLLGSGDEESAYAKDSKTVFFFGDPVPSADAKTFVQLNGRYGKDLRHVYFMKRVVPKADLASFTAPYKSFWYARDKDHVFSGADIFEKADPDTFSTGDDRYCGKNCTYRYEDKNYRFDLQEHIVQKLCR
jgi:hypothetical protein